MLTKLTLIIKRIIERLRKTMARPRTIQLEQGEITLSGFPKDVADALSEHIKAFGKVPALSCVEPITISDAVIPTPPEATVSVRMPCSEFKEKAIGVRFDQETNRTQMVTVAYDYKTKEAIVENVHVADGKHDAMIKFKIAASNLNFV